MNTRGTLLLLCLWALQLPASAQSAEPCVCPPPTDCEVGQFEPSKQQEEQPDSDFDSYVARATQSYEQDSYQQAIAHLENAERVAAGDEQFAKVYNSLGWVHLNDGNAEVAKQYLQQAKDKALAYGLDSALLEKIENNLGILEYSSGRLDEAEQHFRSDWAQGSETSENYLKLIGQQRAAQQVDAIIAEGVRLGQQEQFAEAVAKYDEALTLSAGNNRAQEHRGYALFRLERYAEALEALLAARDGAPDKVTVVIHLMKTYCASGQQEQAGTLASQSQALLAANREAVQGDAELQETCGEISDYVELGEDPEPSPQPVDPPADEGA